MIEKYYQHIEENKSKNSVSNNKTAIEQFQEFIQEYGIKIDEVKTYHIIDWIDELLSDGYARRTVREKVYSLSGYYEYIKRREIIDENPASDVDLKKFSDAKINREEDIRYISQEEYQKLLDATHKTRNEVLIRLIWETGMRAQEVADLRISDINREDRHIEFRETKNRKDKVSKRDVYYTRSFKPILRKWLDKGARGAYLGVDDGEEQYLLVSKQASQMRTERISDVIRERAEEAGIQETVYTDQRGRERRKVTPHALRHSYAVHRVRNGMPIVYLQDLMGHSEIDVTRKYLQFKKEDLKEASDRYAP